MTENKRQALIVDDDIDFRYQIKIGLETMGFDVIEAGGVNEAKSLFEKIHPDLAILDLMMEHQDSGFILAWDLKKHFPKLPVIIVTAVSSKTGMDFDSATRNERSWIHADKVLTKPVRFEQLKKAIQELIR